MIQDRRADPTTIDVIWSTLSMTAIRQPEGLGNDSPGQRPGCVQKNICTPKSATNHSLFMEIPVDVTHRSCPSPSGWIIKRTLNPGRCPGLACSSPSG
jgi:hypothetical protein